jgi:hypothetical protein
MTDMNPEYREAVRRLQARRRLRRHAWAFLGVNAALAAVNLATWTGYAWCLWPLWVWSVGLAFHAWSALVPRGNALQERRVREIITTLRRRP